MSDNPNQPSAPNLSQVADAALNALKGLLEQGVKAAVEVKAVDPNVAIDAGIQAVGSFLRGLAAVAAELDRAVRPDVAPVEPTATNTGSAETPSPSPVKTEKLDRPLSGKVALVTGSTSGIGLGIARALAALGANIGFNGFADSATIEAIHQDIAKAYGVRCAYFAADLSKGAEAQQMVAQAIRHFGSVDILVNNAGIQHVAPIEDFPDEKWDAIIAINLSAAFHTVKAAIPAMKASGWGRIVNISSAHGLVASPQKSAYVAAKHGLVGFTKSAALELANAGVTANCICPGWVLTPMVEKQIADRAQLNGTTVQDETAKLLGEKQPMKSFSTVEQIGAIAAFLCSDAASTITGTAMSVDGGWVAE